MINHARDGDHPLCSFAACVPPKELTPSDVRTRVKECFEKLPSEYYRVESRTCGGLARCLTHEVKFVNGETYELALVSATLEAEAVGRKFEEIREQNVDLKERSLALKAWLKDLSEEHKFSFVVIDDTTKRVFAAATQFSAPLSFGHSKDGMLLIFCGAGGRSVATHWPLNESEVTQCARQGAAARRRSIELSGRTNQRRSVDGGSRRSVDGGRRSVDGGRRSIDGGRRSVDAKAVFTSEVGWVDPGATVPLEFNPTRITLTHLPVGRFVYGHAYLQPYEFTSFWSSAQSNRAGMPERAFHSGNDWAKESDGSRRESFDAGGPGSRRSSMDERRAKWEHTNAKCDTETTWKRAAPTEKSPAPLPPRSPTKERAIEASLETLSVDASGKKTTKKTSLGTRIRRNLSLERLKDALGMKKT
ncbi:hypothetical protein BE221DRAFT_190274, partial [Ostreococcus tauri]